MFSNLKMVQVSDDKKYTSSESSESSEEGVDDLDFTEYYRDAEYWENLLDPRTKEIVIGIDPGPKLCGFFVVVRRDIPDKHGRFFIVLAAATITSNVGGTAVERVSAFAHLPWDNWVLARDDSLKKAYLRIEKQEQRRFGTYREDNNHLVGVISGSAYMYGIKNIEVISATVKLGKPMLEYCGMPKDTVVPRGPKNRINRKKLGVEVMQKWMDTNRNFTAAAKLSLVKQSHGIFDMCDAGLTAVSRFRPTATSGKKRKREK